MENETDLPTGSRARARPIPERRYFRIGEVSKITGVKAYVLRYWESEFRWMAPQKSRSKQRLYRRRDIEMILLIKKLLYGQRYTIAGARKKLREMGVGARSRPAVSRSRPITARATARSATSWPGSALSSERAAVRFALAALAACRARRGADRSRAASKLRSVAG
jgi:DNA-binding transcriptional MerR regulator